MTLAAFSSINFIGGLNGVTGPNNTIAVNSITDFIQVGLTGIAGTAPLQMASGAMVQWNKLNISVLGAMGHTNIGTAAGWVLLNKSAYYQVNSKLNFTGLPSGVIIQSQQFLGATGGLGSGTPISQSLAYLNVGPASGAANINALNSSYVVYVPSGNNITTWVNYLSQGGVPGGGSPVFFSPTGSSFDIRNIGT